MTIDELERLLALTKTLDRKRAGQATDTCSAIDTFLLDCEAGRLSTKTVKWYKSILAPFAAEFEDRAITSIDATDIRRYLAALAARQTRYEHAPQRPAEAGQLSASTLVSHTTALAAFWRWTGREYGIPHPMQNVRQRKHAPSAPRAISPADFRALFDATGNDAAGYRNRAILAVLADTGVRLAGLCSMTLDNVSISDRHAEVTEKGEKTRAVVFTKYTAQLVSQWLAHRRPTESRALFTSITTGSALSSNGVSQAIERMKERAGITGRTNPHAFRHAFAREYLRAGGDAIRLARLIGHTSPTTTAAYYAIFTPDELAEVHEQFSPLKRMLEP